jgi:hypothetical protein
VTLRILTAAIVLLFSNCAAAQCDPGDVVIGETAHFFICQKRSAYIGSEAERLCKKYFILTEAIKADQNAIKEFGFTIDSERFDLYEKISKERKEKLEGIIFNLLLDQGLEAVRGVVKAGSSLNPFNVNRTIALLESKGLKNKTIMAALRKIAATKDKPQMAKAIGELIDGINSAREGWAAGEAAAEDPSYAERHLIVGALKILLGSSELGLAITAAEVAENYVYLFYLTGEVASLARETDDKLIRLSALSARLKGHVADRRLALNSWREEIGQDAALATEEAVASVATVNI